MLFSVDADFSTTTKGGTDEAIYLSQLPAGGDYNLTPVITYKDLAQFDKGRKEFKAFEEAWLKKISEQREPEANRYYGHLWWTNRTGRALGEDVPRDAVYMSGWGRRACFVVPSLDMVVVRLGSDRRLNEHPEYYHELWKRLMAAVIDKPQVG